MNKVGDDQTLKVRCSELDIEIKAVGKDNEKLMVEVKNLASQMETSKVIMNNESVAKITSKFKSWR